MINQVKPSAWAYTFRIRTCLASGPVGVSNLFYELPQAHIYTAMPGNKSYTW